MRGQLERGAEPIDPDFYARWLKSKGSLDEAEVCIRAHAAWREAFVTRGRIQEVLTFPLSMSMCFDYDMFISDHASRRVCGVGNDMEKGSVPRKPLPDNRQQKAAQCFSAQRHLGNV